MLPLASILIWIPFAALAVALLWKRPRWLVPAAIALTVLDLARAGMGQNPAIPVAHARDPPTGAMAAIGDERFVAVGGADAGITPLTANVGMRYGLRDARGYDYPTDKRYDDLWRRAVTKPDPLGFTLPSTMANASSRRAAGAGVARRVAGDERPRRCRCARSTTAPDARVYANPSAVPRAFVVGAETVTDDQLGAVTAAGFDPRATAVVSAPLGLRGSGGSARIVTDEHERVVVRASAEDRGLLVLADTWFPGWRAKVDGRDAPIVRTDQLLRGVVIGPGAHTVEFAYRAASWRIGWIVSLLTAAGAGARRRGGGDDAASALAAAPLPGARAGVRLAGARARQGALELRHALVPGAVGGVASRRRSQRAANPELGDAPQQMQPFLREVKRNLPGRPAVEPVDHHRAPAACRRAVGDLLALQLDRLRDGRVAGAGADRGAEAVGGGVRHVPAGPGAVDALAGRGAGRDRLRLQPVDGHVDLVSARERVGAGPVGAAGGGGGAAAAGAPRRTALLALVIGLQFLCGHPESSFHLLVGGRRVRALRLRAPVVEAGGSWRSSAALAWGAALAALVLLPCRRTGVALGRSLPAGRRGAATSRRR